VRIVQIPRAGIVEDHQGEHHFFQVSTLDALMDRRFDGDVTCGELAGHGDHGVGTLNGLDGELILIDGAFFQITADGRAHEVDPDRLTPFAIVTFFQRDRSLSVEAGAERSEIQDAIEELAGSPEEAIAVRIRGHFPFIRARSAEPQRTPYRDFPEAVAANQRAFDLMQRTGTMFGFRFPSSIEGVQIPGYHLHFLSDNHEVGGHVLDYRAAHVGIDIQLATGLQIELPPGVRPAAPGLSPEALRAIHSVEG
jgi:acetolactate decarboxylase